MKATYLAAIAAVCLLLGSCSTPKNVAYFQNATPGATIDLARQLDLRVKPEDKLSIIVSAQDPELSNLFNLVQVQNRVGQFSSASRGSSLGGYNEGRTSYYTVDSKGDINFPVLGNLHIGGMRREEVADYICRELTSRDLVRDPIVTVEFANTGVSIIGEVAYPGHYEFNRDRLSIIDAIALAGDLKPNGQRQNIKVIRETANGRQEVYVVDLTDMAQIAQSPAYYLQQNDVIYVEPNAKAKRETTAAGNTPLTPSFWVTVSSLGVSVATLIVTLSRN